MEFKIGQKWSTRGGVIVTIVDLYQDGREHPVIGVFSNSKELQEFRQSGRFISDDSDAPGDLIELVQEAHNYASPNQYSFFDYFKFLERQYLIDGAVTIPSEVKAKTATLVQAITYMMDQENLAEPYDN
jgi:hypothetical protein